MLQGRLTKRNLFMAGKLTFAPNLYLGESIASEKLDKLKKETGKKNLFLAKCLSHYSGEEPGRSARYF